MNMKKIKKDDRYRVIVRGLVREKELCRLLNRVMSYREDFSPSITDLKLIEKYYMEV